MGLFLSVFFILGLSFGVTPKVDKSPVSSAVQMAPKASGEEATVIVNGMVCSFCAQGIEKKFHKHKSVDGIKVDLDNKKVVIQFKKGADITDKELTTLLKKSGYDVVGIKRAAKKTPQKNNVKGT